MGVSTDAILVYGVTLDDFEGEIAESLPFTDEDGDADREEGLELVRHCHIDYNMWIIGLAATETTASRGYVETITSLEEPHPADVIKITRFLEANGLKGTPGWLLCSCSEH